MKAPLLRFRNRNRNRNDIFSAQTHTSIEQFLRTMDYMMCGWAAGGPDSQKLFTSGPPESTG